MYLAVARPLSQGLMGLRQGAGESALQIGSTVATAGAAKIATVLGVTVPVVGAAIAGVTLAVTALLRRRNPQQKRDATRVVEEIEPQMQANLAAYMESNRTRVDQQATLQNFDMLWQTLESACSSPSGTYSNLAGAGHRCVDERKRGGVYDYFRAYRDPIADDPSVADQFAPSIFGIAPDRPGLIVPALAAALGLVLVLS